MRTKTKYFGEIEIDEKKTIQFADGIPGFETLKRFALLGEEDSPFFYLQSMEQAQVCFVMMNPYELMPDYAPFIHESYFEKLGGGNTTDFALYVIVTMSGDLKEATVNLKAPLLVHIEKNIGVQAIVEDKMYTTRHGVAQLVAGRSSVDASSI